MRIVCGLFGWAVLLAGGQGPEFSFGVVADVQYADQDSAMGREYRESAGKLERCVSLLNKERLEFVVQLGDLVDGGSGNLRVIRRVFEKTRARRYDVLGNHDREVMVGKMERPYYEFGVKGWRFVVLDGMGETGRGTLEKLKAEGAVNAQSWNGAVGEVQREWLRGVLREASERKERAVVFCHFPVLPESCRPEHLLWDYREVLEILDGAPAVAAYMNGHDHRGGYGVGKGVHYLTLPGMVEHEGSQSCQVVDVYAGALVVRQAGDGSGRAMKMKD